MVLAAEFFRLMSPIVSIVSSPVIVWQALKTLLAGPGSSGALPSD
jgi:hypothetical protein